MSKGAATVDGSARRLAPQVAASAVVIGTALLGDGVLLSQGGVIRSRSSSVTIGTGSAVIENAVVVGTPEMPTFIGPGVKIIGDSHGPVRIRSDVQILENTVLHLLPDNELIIDDGAVIDGFPAVAIGAVDPMPTPPWAMRIDDLPGQAVS